VRVLLIDDDARLAELLRGYFDPQGVALVHAAAGQAGLNQLTAGGFDAVLLDVMMPGMDGLAVLRKLRDAGHRVPVIMLTARGDEADRVVGLELGADDYVVKPFGLRELVARIRAVTRRVTVRLESENQAVRLHVDRRTRRVVVDGAEVSLTPKEFDLLALLAEDPGAVCARQQILDEVWDPHWYGPTKTLDVHIGSLRRKLGDARWIETVRGVGYRLREDGARV